VKLKKIRAAADGATQTLHGGVLANGLAIIMLISVDSLQSLNTLPLSSCRVGPQFDGCRGWLRMSVDVSVHQHPCCDFLGLKCAERSQAFSAKLCMCYAGRLASVVQCYITGAILVQTDIAII